MSAPQPQMTATQMAQMAQKGMAPMPMHPGQPMMQPQIQGKGMPMQQHQHPMQQMQGIGLPQGVPMPQQPGASAPTPQGQKGGPQQQQPQWPSASKSIAFDMPSKSTDSSPKKLSKPSGSGKEPMPANFEPIPGAEAVPGDQNGDVMDDIENCKLIEKPHQTTVGAGSNLTHHIRDMPGYQPDIPCLRPNCDVRDPKSVVDVANAFSGPNIAKEDRCWGTAFTEGQLPIYEHNSLIKLSNTGRMRLRVFSRSSWTNVTLDLNKDVFYYKTLLFIRVPIGKIGYVTDNGVPKMLAEGAHIFNKGVTTFDRFENAAQYYLNHGAFHIVTVPRGKFAKVWASLADGSPIPRLLGQGMHCIQNNFFKFEGLVNVNDKHIAHGAINVFSIPKGEVAKVFHENKPRLFGEGNHVIESTNFFYNGCQNLNEKCIQHGTMTILRVPKGDFWVCWLRNQPHFIEKWGLYTFDTPDFKFEKHVSANEKKIELGAKKLIMVWTGEVGVAYDHGELRVLHHGRHLIEDASTVFDTFLSTQQKSIRLVTETASERQGKKKAMEKRKELEKKGLLTNFDESAASSSTSLARGAGNSNDDMLACETKDLVKVGVRADVFYSIQDPEKAIRNIRAEEIEDLVRETAIATLTNIIRSTALNEIAQSKLPNAVSTQQSEAQRIKDDQERMAQQALGGGASAPMFFDKAHDDFLSKLHDDFLNRYGLDIANIRIESFKIMDDELAEQISRQALVTAQTENQLANLKGQTEIATAEQHREAEVARIAAEAEATSMKVRQDAENLRRVEASRAWAEAERLTVEINAAADAEKVRIAAEADANAAMMRAKAKAESIKLVADAESKRAWQLSETTLGQQQALLTTYCDMMKDANKGVEKIVYCDPTLTQNGSAFSMPAIQNLNRDLQMLNGMGGTPATTAPNTPIDPRSKSSRA